jgi:hypothetical protein
MESSYLQKKEIVINIILYERKQQAMKISSFLKNKLNQNIKIKKFIIKQKILENIILIQKYFRAYSVRKMVTDYLSKIRTSYLIKSGIEENIKNLQMIVFYNNKNKIFDFYYDKFFQKFIFFMDRTKVQKHHYKIQFICDGRVIIDPQFPTIEENGMYINIIDFDSVKKMEKKHREENNILIKDCCDYLKKNNLSVLPKSFIESYLNEEKDKNDGNYLYEDEGLTRSMNFIMKNKNSSSKMQRNLSSSLSKSTRFEMRAFKSCKKLPKIKGILKRSRRNMVKNNSDITNDRKVSFGWREESF